MNIRNNDNYQNEAVWCNHLELILTVLHDPKRLRIFSDEERRGMVKSYILYRLLTPQGEMDIMKAKQLVLQGKKKTCFITLFTSYIKD